MTARQSVEIVTGEVAYEWPPGRKRGRAGGTILTLLCRLTGLVDCLLCGTEHRPRRPS